MQLTNCHDCGLLFYRHGSGRRCPDCIQEEEDAFHLVCEHIRETRERSIPRIAEATGVSQHLIVHWLRQKRLALQVVPGELQCRRCGIYLDGGTFCDKCREELANEVAEARRMMGETPREKGAPAPTPEAEEPSAPEEQRRGMHYRRAMPGRG